MMNLKSNDLLIDFIFETGKQQDAFRATVSGRRNSKKFEDVKALERTAYKKESGNWIPIECSALEEAVGLSYENFKRTIIIPQGQFQEFLQLGNKDRTKMMRELFNLEKFELYYKTAELEAKNNEKMQNLHGQLQQLGEINQEEIEILETQQNNLQREIEEQDKHLAGLQQQEIKWQQLQELAKKLAAAKETLANLQKKEPEFNRLGKTLLQYENCVLCFKTVIDSLDTSHKKIALKKVQIENGEQQLKNQIAEIKQKEEVLAVIKKEFENRETLKQKADELAKLVKIISLEQQIETEKSRFEKGGEFVKKAEEECIVIKNEKQKLEQEIKIFRQNLPDMDILSQAKSWHTENQILAKQAAEVKAETGKFQNENNELQQNLLNFLQSNLFADFSGEKNGTGAKLFLEEKSALVKAKRKSLEKEAAHFRVKMQLGKYAGELEDGKPCPLCGSVHHPDIYSAENIQGQQQNLDMELANLEKELERINETAQDD